MNIRTSAAVIFAAMLTIACGEQPKDEKPNWADEYVKCVTKELDTCTKNLAWVAQQWADDSEFISGASSASKDCTDDAWGICYKEWHEYGVINHQIK
jgi:hypothetical protein